MFGATQLSGSRALGQYQPTDERLDMSKCGAFPVNPVGFEFWSVLLPEKSWLAILSGLIEVFTLVAEDCNHYEATNAVNGFPTETKNNLWTEIDKFL